MSSGLERPITIADAIQNIDQRKYLLPALQRKFVWNTSRIEVLFDILLRGYPINSFMFWEVTTPDIKTGVRFYEFLKTYRQRYNEDNSYFDTANHPDFSAVIDGQQRLTSIYIGLKGSYAYKTERKHWYNTEDALPTRFLYLNLKKPLPAENERSMYYDLYFLSPAEADYYNTDEPDEYDYFKVEEIFKTPKATDLSAYIFRKNYHESTFALETLTTLREVIFDKHLINYYLEKNQNIDMVLDVFIRTNSGGIPLSFSDLLMSIVTASWERLDARVEMDNLLDLVFDIQDKQFEITKDFVLKTCLVLLSEDIKFKAQTFNSATIQSFERSWTGIKKAILAAFQLIAAFGLGNHSLRAKNAAIPIVYFIYRKDIAGDILNPLRYKEDKASIQKWLYLSLLKRVFGGQSDSTLIRLRKILKESLDKGEKAGNIKATSFPLDGIRSEFKTDPARNLSMDDTFIEDLLSTQKDDPNSFPILSLLYPNINFYDQDFHKDHLHPASYFNNETFQDDVAESEWSFFSDARNWNSILNLQLLNNHLNTSKNSSPLKEWVASNHVDLDTQIIPRDCDLHPAHFKSFIQKRKEMLISRIKNLL
jgi:uncharacterized protein with ParB-like and HNH nuclease domain